MPIWISRPLRAILKAMISRLLTLYTFLFSHLQCSHLGSFVTNFCTAPDVIRNPVMVLVLLRASKLWAIISNAAMSSFDNHKSTKYIQWWCPEAHVYMRTKGFFILRDKLQIRDRRVEKIERKGVVGEKVNVGRGRLGKMVTQNRAPAKISPL